MTKCNKNYKDHGERRCRNILTVILILLLVIGVTALILYLLYRPEKPQYAVADAAVYDLNITASPPTPLVCATMQFTLTTRNPNKRVSAYYDRLSAFVLYRSQPLTPPAALPPLHLKEGAAVAMSPVLGGGTPVPVTDGVVNGLLIDEGYGVVCLRVVVTGRLRWRAGAIRTGRRGFSVRCDVLMGLRKGLVGRVPLLASPGCKVDT